MVDYGQTAPRHSPQRQKLAEAGPDCKKQEECLYDITPNRVAHKNAFISVIGEIKKPTDMKALIQKEIIRKPIYSHGEDINGRMESETTIVQILGVIVFKKVIQLLSVS